MLVCMQRGGCSSREGGPAAEHQVLGRSGDKSMPAAQPPAWPPFVQEAELASWQAAQGAAAGGGGAGVGGQAGALAYRRLASEEEVAPLVRQAEELMQPKKDQDDGAWGGASGGESIWHGAAGSNSTGGDLRAAGHDPTAALPGTSGRELPFVHPRLQNRAWSAPCSLTALLLWLLLVCRP